MRDLLFDGKWLFKTLAAFLACAAMTSTAASANSALTITFDDLPWPPQGGARVPEDYAGFHWYHFGYLDAMDQRLPDGLRDAVVSPDNIAVDRTGRPAWFCTLGQAFNLDSAYLTAQENDVLQVRVAGFFGDTLEYDNVYTLYATQPTLIDFNYQGITKVEFIPLAGNPYDLGSYFDATKSLPLGGGHFAIDNLCVTLVPEPGPAALLMAGGLLAGINYRRRWTQNLRLAPFARVHRKKRFGA